MANPLIDSILRDLKVERDRRLANNQPPMTKDQIDRFVREASKGGFKDFYQLAKSFEYLVDGKEKLGKDVGNFGDVMREFFAGASFEFADEMEALVMSKLEKVPYDVVKDQIKREREAFQQQYPGRALTANLAGAVAPALLPGGQAAAASRLGQLGQTAVKALNPGQTAAQAVRGMAIGKSGALPALAQTRFGQGAIGGAVDAGLYSAGMAENPTQATGQDVSDVYANVAGSAAVSGGGALIAAPAGKAAAQSYRVLRNLISDGSGGIIPPSNPQLRGIGSGGRKDLEDILADLEGGKVTPEQLMQALDVFDRVQRKNLGTLVDAGQYVNREGNPLYLRAKNTMSVPAGGAAYRKSIGERQAIDAVQDRLTSDVDLLGKRVPETEIYAREAQARIQADPLYKQADPQTLTMTQPIRDFLETPYAQRAYSNAEELRDLRQRNLPVDQRVLVSSGIQEPLTVQQLDDIQKAVRAQQGLDVTNPPQNQKNVLTKEGKGLLDQLKDRALDDAGQQVPEYREARRVFAEGMLVDEFNQGLQDFSSKKRPIEVKAYFDKLPAEKQEAYRSGMQQALVDKWGEKSGKTADLTAELRKNKQTAKLEAISSPEQMAQLLERMEVEEVFQEATALSPRAGAETQRLIVQEQKAAPTTGQMIADVSNPGQLAGRAVDRLREKFRSQMDFEEMQRQKERFAERLFATGDDARRTVDELAALQKLQSDDEIARRMGIGALARTSPFLTNPETRNMIQSLLY